MSPDDDWVHTLAADGVVVRLGWLATELVDALRAEVGDGEDRQAMYRAGVGRGSERRVVDAVRGDWIRWLDGSTVGQQSFLQQMEAVRRQVNAATMMGLFDIEAHFALYPPGRGYERHLDAFQRDNPRRLSAVLYLNRDWCPQDGGELALYDSDGREQQRILPKEGTLVLFLSQSVPHAVLPARRWRASIAAWFRIREAA